MLSLWILLLLWSRCEAGQSSVACPTTAPRAESLTTGTSCGSSSYRSPPTPSGWTSWLWSILGWGAPEPELRIVAGSSATIQNAPFMALIQVVFSKRQAACGGAIISNKHVLTAAHCFYDSANGNEAAASVNVGVGSAQPGTLIAVTSSNIYKHPKFVAGNRNKDIAIIRLPTALTFGPTIQPICVPVASTSLRVIGCSSSFYGWGSTSASSANAYSSISSSLTQMSFNVPNPATACISTGETQIFCTTASGSSRMCFGDTGGPLVVRFNNVAYAMGVGADITSCAVASNAFTRVGGFSGWIKNITVSYP